MSIRNSIFLGIISALFFVGCSGSKEETKKEAPAKEVIKDTAKAVTTATAAQQSSAFAIEQPVAKHNEHSSHSAKHTKHNENCSDCDHAKKDGVSVSVDDKSVGVFSIKDIFAKRAELNGKIVEVKGEVVKVSENIMGRSWIHIQDGTGEEAKGTHDIIFTSQTQTAVVGDKVTAKGILASDRDFGYGYKYSVIIESSIFIK